MKFTETKLTGVFIIEMEMREDERGFFARSFCADEFAAHGLNPTIAQCNVSFNRHAGTLRGMHFQAAPYGETKLIRCTQGAVYDVVVDLLKDSPTFQQWVATELTAHNHRMIYVPEGFAHGMQTLVDNSELFYMMGSLYVPEAARGVRWDDPAFGIEWPDAAERIIAKKDLEWDLMTDHL